ncbi:ABC transporter ATP-binding protein [Rhodophyticola sp. CCM32]|uniref:ABC transporter ATP-binding protein n=1 Tax=Rhodophyticola sp. CCM32 TaxID=2916397 RepID=UPI00107F1F1D|nr:ABC transporter ATP-binding protein [Rhodophyticola sp. CCM32]QBY00803.1 ABC transporter ATP-binding protein [Rhodophyticola sp. CCM32]
MTHIKTTALQKSFGGLPVLKDINLEIEDGEFVVIVGPSGCGKSTLLRVISGLEGANSGQIHFNGKDVTSLDPGKRKVAMVFQSYALYPHMSVEQNIGFATRVHGASKAQLEDKIKQVAEILRLGDYLDRRPSELSGGQKQRVAIGRAIIRDPGVFLFDEPLSNLDAELRVEMRLELTELHKRLGRTMIYVTHDQVEAMTLADRIIILRDGCLEQVGTPRELYFDPDNIFVAGFLGTPKMSFLAARALRTSSDKTMISLDNDPDFKISVPVTIADGTRVVIGIRPENMNAGSGAKLTVTPHLIEDLGGSQIAYCRTPGGAKLTVQYPADADITPDVPVDLVISAEAIQVFDEETGARIR